MKKKIISIFLILAFVVMLIPKAVSATTVNTKCYEFTVPNKYEAGYENVTDTSVFKSYRYYDKNLSRSTSVTFGSYKTSYPSTYTQSDVNTKVASMKKSYQNDEDYTLKSISGKLVEINGVKGYRIYEQVKSNSTGNVYAYVDYTLGSDNYNTYISFSCDPQFVDSTEFKSIINSFKMKDTVTASRGIPYTDVASSAWYYNAVKYAYDNGIITGYNDYTFAPYDKLTRGMLVTILWRMEKSPNNDGKSKFSDVASSAWYAKAVKWASSKGIVNGYKTGKFGPKDNITREQLAAILMNYAKYKGKNVSARADTSKFKDFNKTSSVFKNAVSWCVAKKIISGKENGTKVDPKGNATRAEAASMIMSYCQNVK